MRKLQRKLESGRLLNPFIDSPTHAIRRPMQFRLDKYRPDLTKLDDLVARLACESGHFAGQVSALASLLQAGGLDAGVDTMKSSEGDYGLYFAIRCFAATVEKATASI